MSYPTTSDFTWDTPGAAYWTVTNGTRRILIRWDGWDFVAMLRRILYAYLTSGRVEWSQRFIGARDYIDLVMNYPLQVAARHFTFTYSALPGATSTRYDVAADWNGISVQPAEVVTGGEWWVGPTPEGGRPPIGEALTVNDLRAVYALVSMLSTGQDVASLRIALAMPANALNAIRAAATGGPMTHEVMQVLTALVSATLLGPLDGPFTVEVPLDAVPLVLGQEAKRPAGAPLQPTILDVTNPAQIQQYAPAASGLSTGAKIVIGLGAAAVAVGLGWWWFRSPARHARDVLHGAP